MQEDCNKQHRNELPAGVTKMTADCCKMLFGSAHWKEKSRQDFFNLNCFSQESKEPYSDISIILDVSPEKISQEISTMS